MLKSGFLLHSLLIIVLALRGYPAASNQSVNLITVPNSIFWNLDWVHVSPFVSNLHLLMDRLRGPEGKTFAMSYAFSNVHSLYHEPFCFAINQLTVDLISQILFENNANINRVILEIGLQYCPVQWNRLDLTTIPKQLVPRFPIEYLNQEALRIINLNVIADIILARSDKNLFKMFPLLNEKLPSSFWKLEKIIFCPVMRMRISAFHIRINDEIMTKLPPGNPTDLKMVFKLSYANLFEFALNIDAFRCLDSAQNLDANIYSILLRHCSLFNFIAQTYLHSMLSDDKYNQLLISYIIENSNKIKSLIRNRLRRSPEESVHLEHLLRILNECYSYLVLSAINSNSNPHRSDILNYFGARVYIEYVDVVGTISAITGETFSDIKSIHPEVLLQTLFMAGNEASIDPAVPELVNYLTDNFMNPTRGIVSLLQQSSQMLNSFGQLIKRNRNLTHRLYVRFLNSNINESVVNMVRRIVSDDYEYVASIVSKGELMDHSKYAVVLADGFKENGYLNKPSRSPTKLPEQFQITFEPQSTGMENLRLIKPFGSKMNYSKKRKFCRGFQVDEQKRKAADRSYSLVSSDDEGPLNDSQHHIYIPDISTSFDPSFTPNEYIHVDYFLKRSRKKGNENQLLAETTAAENKDEREEINPEIRFLNEMLKAIHNALKNPLTKFVVHIDGSGVSGFGLLKDSLTNFGKLLGLPRFKTLEESSQGGYFPLPLLCPKVMGYIGAWMTLCIKHKVPLPWNFTSDYRKFLFNAPDQVSIDELIEKLYGQLFDTIRMRFVNDDESYAIVLPNISKMHRLFHLPNSSEPPTPFLIESRFLEQSLENDLFLVKFKSKKFLVAVDEYLSFLHISIRSNLIEGRNEFQKCFKKFFKKEFVPFLTYYALEPYVGENNIDADGVWNALRFTGSGSEFSVVDDFDLEYEAEEGKGEDTVGSETDSRLPGQRLLAPNELFKKIIYKLTTEQLEQFLIFTTGAPRLCNSVIQSRVISYFAVRAESPRIRYCLGHTCFNQFMLVIHNRSAKATYENFIESITSGSGFALREF